MRSEDSYHLMDELTDLTVVRVTRPRPRPAAGSRQRSGSPRLHLVWVTSLIELRSSFRSVEFAVGAIAIPVVLYAMFGLPSGDSLLPAGTPVTLAMLVSIACYGVVSLAIFTFGEDVAKERGRGWPRTLAASPFPTWVYLTGKSASALVHALLIVFVMSLVAATAGGVRLTALEWLTLGATLVSGVVLFSTMGFAIAYLARPRAATVITNLIFLPLSFASGFFFPLGELPDIVGKIAQWLPTYHFGQLAYRTAMPVDDVEFWVGREAQEWWIHAVWIALSAVTMGAVTLLAARRESVTRRR